MPFQWLLPWVICLAVLIGGGMRPVVADAGTLRIVVDDQSGKRLPCRIHLKNRNGEPQRAAERPFFHDHFVCPGEVTLRLPAGRFRFEVERGPEYKRHSGAVDVLESGVKTVSIRLERIADLAAKGWYSGELHVHRSIEDIELLMRAEDLHVAPVITWWNNRNLWTDRKPPESPLLRFDGNRFYHMMGGEDEREGGALMFFNGRSPLAIAGSSREYPSPMKFVEEAKRDQATWIDIEKPFWWDVPAWLAGGQIDSIGLANNHMCRSTMYADEAWGRPRDAKRLPPPQGNGYWTQEIYYQMLNCGLRVPPSAGSASGVLPNPVGYNRVYVHVDGDLDYEEWWKGLKAGRSFVTNGPLLLCRANGQLPGHVFTAEEGEQVKIDVSVSLTSREKVPALEIIKNGEIERAVRPDRLSESGNLGTVTFNQSGWFLIRAITDVKHTFRFASTAPYYVEIGPSKRRISERSARFFLDWTQERAQRVKRQLKDGEKLREVLVYHRQAKKFWQDLVADANTE